MIRNQNLEKCICFMPHWIERIWKLRAPEHRRTRTIPARWFLPVYRPERDADYLLGQLLDLVLLGGILLVGAILLDAHLATDFLVDADRFRDDKLLLPVIFSRLIGFPVFALSLLFYLRIRLCIDICRDDIPVGGRKEWVLSHSRRKWIQIAAMMLFWSPPFIFMSHIIVRQVTGHYEQEDNLGFILLPQAFAVVEVAVGAVLLPYAMLVLEKAVRCFPEFQENVRRNHEYTREIHKTQQ